MKLVLGAIALALLATQAIAAPITGTSGSGAPTVAGQTGVATFDTSTHGSFASVVSGDLTVSGIGGDLRVANDYPNQYNGRGAAYLDNDQGYTSGFRFDFASVVSAFAFNWGASDVSWTLSAFDASGHLLESVLTPIVNGSNAGDFVGLANTGIRYATLTSNGGSDWVFVDNVSFAAEAVPEPASIALIGLGLAGVVGLRRRRKV